MAAGEFPVAVFSNGHEIEQMKREKAPVQWTPARPVLTTQTMVALSRHESNPNGARLYIDYVLSGDGQELLRSFNRIPARADVPANPARLTKGLKLFPYKGEWGEEYDKYADQFRKIFQQ